VHHRYTDVDPETGFVRGWRPGEFGGSAGARLRANAKKGGKADEGDEEGVKGDAINVIFSPLVVAFTVFLYVLHLTLSRFHRRTWNSSTTPKI
jgi:hypothetical protein